MGNNNSNNSNINIENSNNYLYYNNNLKEIKNNVNNNTHIATLVYNNKERYEGEIFNNKRSGYGVYYYALGDKYQGMWCNNMKHGKGTLYYRNGEIYEGWWNNNNKEGVGTYYYLNGDNYYGEWKNNKRNGNGILQYKDGSKYIGEFKDNKKHGKGEYEEENNENAVFNEEYNMGVLIKKVAKNKVNKKDQKKLLVNNNQDYRHQFDPDNFQKIIDNKNTNQIDNMKKSKYLPIEIAKFIRNRNMSDSKVNINEFIKTISQDILVEKKGDITNWKNDDVVVLFKNLELDKYTSYLINNNIDGIKFVSLEFNQIINEMEIKDKNEINLLLLCHDLLKKIKKEGDYLKSGNDIKSLNNSIIKVDNKFNPKKVNEDKHAVGTNINNSNSIKMLKLNKNEIVEKELQSRKNTNNTISKKTDTKNDISNNNLNTNNNEENELIDIKKNQTYNPHENIYSNVNLNGLSFYIKFKELALEKEVGKGAFGIVFLAKWNGINVAVKRISYDNKEYISRFINEINIISSLRHPNVVLYMGASIFNQSYYMITEYLPKGSLWDYIHNYKVKFTEREQINITYEIAIGLSYLHSRSIVHCDLKSSNILIDDNWKIKIGDFGLSHFIKNNNRYYRVKKGTVNWMAPESLKSGIYGYSTDIYSFGMILWEILKLEIPYFGLKQHQIENQIVQENRIVEIPKEGHEVLIDITKKCLEYDPNKRPSIRDIVIILENLKNMNKYVDKNLEDLYHFLS